MQFVLDSSVFISYLNKQDPFHPATKRLVVTLSQDEDLLIIIPIIVFLEVANVLTGKVARFDENELLAIFAKYEIVELTLDLSRKVVPFFEKTNLKTSDATIIATAKLSNSTLITWDKKLQKEAQKLVKTLTPKGLLE